MARRLFVHIGMMKTGTTYLQEVCNELADELEGEGIHLACGSTHRQIHAVAELRDSANQMPSSAGAWKRLCREVKRTDKDVLISHELIAPMRPDMIRRFVSDLAVEETVVIVTTRDLSRILAGRWTSALRSRRTETWAEYLAAVTSDDLENDACADFWAQADVARGIRNWQAGAQPSRTVVITVPRSSAPRDELWRRFASVIGADPDLAGDLTIRDNSSLGWVSAEVIRRMNLRFEEYDWPEYRLSVKSVLGNGVLIDRASQEGRYVLPPDSYAWVERRTARMVEEIRALDVEVVGDLDELTPQPATNGISDPTQMPSDRELLEATTDGLEGVLRLTANWRMRAKTVAAENRRLRQQLRDVGVEPAPDTGADDDQVGPGVWGKLRKVARRRA